MSGNLFSGIQRIGQGVLDAGRRIIENPVARSRITRGTVAGGVGVGILVGSQQEENPTPSGDQQNQQEQQRPSQNSPAEARERQQPQQALMNRDAAQTLADRLLDPSRFIDNPLNDDLQVAYHFRLFVTNDQDLLANAGSGLNSTAQMLSVLDQRAQVTIAESGVTAGISIKDVTIESLVAPNYRTRNVNATKITMTVVEPLGTSFLDQLASAANGLGVMNHQRSFYFLELTFRAYDEAGNLSSNPALIPQQYEPANGGRWVWMVQLKSVETKIDSTGGAYTVEMKPWEEQIFSEETLLRLPETFTVSASTVGQFLEGLREHLNRSWRHRYGGDLVRFTGIITHPVTAGSFTGDPSTIPLRPADGERHNERNLSMESAGGNNTRSHLRMGSNLNDVIEFMFMNSERAQDLGLDRGRQQGQVNQAPGQVNDRGFRESVVFRVEPELTVTGYDDVHERYMFDVKLHIWPYYTQAPILSEAQVENAERPEVQQEMIRALTERGFLRKRYDYIFTGKNTEVRDADLKFNIAWSAVVPSLGGAQASIDAATTGSRMNPYSQNPQYNRPQAEPDLRVQQRELREQIRNVTTRDANAAASEARIQDDIRRLERQQSQTSSPEIRRSLQTQINGLTADLADLGQGRAGNANQIERLREQYNALGGRARPEATVPEGARQFSEDTVVGPAVRTEVQPLRISFEQQGQENRQNVGIGFLGQYHRDKSVLGAALEQLYEPFTAMFITVDLSIRGDPFWLGQGNLERQLALRNSAGTSQTPAAQREPNSAPEPVWMNGDHCYLLSFRYPYTIGEGGQPLLRGQDVFNGIFRVIRIESSFSEGGFTQRLMSQRLPLIDVLRAFGATGTRSNGQRANGQQAGGSAAASPLNARASLTGTPAGTGGGSTTPSATPQPAGLTPSFSFSPVSPQPAQPPAPRPSGGGSSRVADWGSPTGWVDSRTGAVSDPSTVR